MLRYLFLEMFGLSLAALFLPAAVEKAIINYFYMRYGFLVFVYTLCIVYNKVIGEMASFATSLI